MNVFCTAHDGGISTMSGNSASMSSALSVRLPSSCKILFTQAGACFMSVGEFLGWGLSQELVRLAVLGNYGNSILAFVSANCSSSSFSDSVLVALMCLVRSWLASLFLPCRVSYCCSSYSLLLSLSYPCSFCWVGPMSSLVIQPAVLLALLKRPWFHEWVGSCSYLYCFISRLAVSHSCCLSCCVLLAQASIEVFF